eukprot:30811-Pelagococcus_subviridis.AAC.2
MDASGFGAAAAASRNLYTAASSNPPRNSAVPTLNCALKTCTARVTVSVASDTTSAYPDTSAVATSEATSASSASSPTRSSNSLESFRMTSASGCFLPFAPAAAAPLRRKHSLFLPGGAVRTAKSIAETARANPSSPCSRACCFNVNPGCRRAAAFSRCGVARVHGATPRRRGGGATRFDFDASRVALAVAVVPRAASTRWVRVACAVHASIASASGGASASYVVSVMSGGGSASSRASASSARLAPRASKSSKSSAASANASASTTPSSTSFHSPTAPSVPATAPQRSGSVADDAADDAAFPPPGDARPSKTSLSAPD